MSHVMRVAVLEGTLVINLAMADEENADILFPGAWADATEVFCDIGYIYNPADGTFSPPPDPPDPPPEE